jgi:hypothetical protein
MALTRVYGNLISSGTITGNLFELGTFTGDRIAPYTIGSSNLVNTGVTSGVYGGSTGIPTLTIGQDGRVTYSANVTSVSNLTLTNSTYTNYTESVVAIGSSGASQTISLTNGTLQTVNLTQNCTFTMPSVSAGKSFTVLMRIGANNLTATFTSVKWPSNSAPAFTTSLNRLDIISFISDGTNWYGTVSQDYYL